MLRHWKRILAFSLVVAAAIFGLAMFDPFFKQLTFGPKYDGIPLITWQESFREWDNVESQKSKRQPTMLESIHEAIVPSPSPEKWKKLAGEDRRAILLTLSVDRENRVRMHVAAYLGDVPPSQEVVEVLKGYLVSNHEGIRQYAMVSAGRINPPPMELLPGVLKQMESGDRFFQWGVQSIVLRFAKANPETVVPELVKRMPKADITERISIVAVLGRTQPIRKDALAVIESAAKDQDERVREQAQRALENVKKNKVELEPAEIPG